MSNDELLLTGEMARMLRVKAGTARAWRSRGGGPPYRRLTAGRRGRAVYRLSEVLRWLEERKATSTSDEAARPGCPSTAPSPAPRQDDAPPAHSVRASARGGAR